MYNRLDSEFKYLSLSLCDFDNLFILERGQVYTVEYNIIEHTIPYYSLYIQHLIRSKCLYYGDRKTEEFQEKAQERQTITTLLYDNIICLIIHDGEWTLFIDLVNVFDISTGHCQVLLDTDHGDNTIPVYRLNALIRRERCMAISVGVKALNLYKEIAAVEMCTYSFENPVHREWY